MNSQDAYHALCQALTAARLGGGRTQSEIAAKLARPQSFVSKYESGERRLDVVEFLSICKVLKVDPANIIEKIKV